MRKVTQVLRETRGKKERLEPKVTPEKRVTQGPKAILDHQGHPGQRATQVLRGTPEKKETRETSPTYQR